MTIRVTMQQARAYRKLTHVWKTLHQLDETEATMESLVRSGYAHRRVVTGFIQYKQGDREL